MTLNIQLVVTSDQPDRISLANILANNLQLTLSPINGQYIQLVVTDLRIELRAHDLGSPVFIDFVEGKNAHRKQFGGGRRQPLARAIGLKKGTTPTVIDATAGFAGDAFVLANLGCKITLIERNPLMAILIKDALNRAKDNKEVFTIIKRMSLIHDDAVFYLNAIEKSYQPDIIYMDPMYPRRNKSALVKKNMQLLHQLAGSDTDSENLLITARKTALKRVVVKRPGSAPFVAGQKPSNSIQSKNTRYDIYFSHTP